MLDSASTIKGPGISSFISKRWSSIIKNEIFWYSLEVSHFPESKITYFLEVEDYEELRGQSFSIVGHKHGTLWDE